MDQRTVANVFWKSRGAFVGLFVLSAGINVLMLTGALFMMQIYDRVLGSHSLPTLVALSFITLLAFAFQGMLESVRAHVLALLGERIDGDIGANLHAAVIELPLRQPPGNSERLQPMRDLEMVRSFVASAGPVALFDLPWMWIFLGAVFLLHSLLGFIVVFGILVTLALAYLAEVTSKPATRRANEAHSRRNVLVDTAQRSAEAVRAMGMETAVATRLAPVHAAFLREQRQLGFMTGRISSIARSFRLALQSAVLAVGAYLAIRGEISSGAIIAASILSSRALAPADQAIGGWKGFVATREAWSRLDRLLKLFSPQAFPFELPLPSKHLAVEALTVSPPGGNRPTIAGVSFRLRAGQALAVVGPSASGKSTLLRALLGVWSPVAGRVQLDGSSIDQWNPVRLGEAIGYMPQDVQLLDGTIAENIARFRSDARDEDIIAAATAAGLDQTIRAMPDGYATRVGFSGGHLSAGQRQRIGLARALFGNPFLVVLDEPNSNLDADGDEALAKAIIDVKRRGGILIFVSHRIASTSVVDFVMVMNQGRVAEFGPREAVERKLGVSANASRPSPSSDGRRRTADEGTPDGAANRLSLISGSIPAVIQARHLTSELVVSDDDAIVTRLPVRRETNAPPDTPQSPTLQPLQERKSWLWWGMLLGQNRRSSLWRSRVQSDMDNNRHAMLYEHEVLRGELSAKQLQLRLFTPLAIVALGLVVLCVGATDGRIASAIATVLMWWLPVVLALVFLVESGNRARDISALSDYILRLETQIFGASQPGSERPVGWEQHARELGLPPGRGTAAQRIAISTMLVVLLVIAGLKTMSSWTAAVSEFCKLGNLC